MDISELLELTITALYFSTALALVVTGVYFAVRSRHTWLKLVLPACSTLLLGATLFAIFGELWDADAIMHRPAIYAPDGEHVAIVQWRLLGALGSDEIRVQVRSRRSLFATEVFRDTAQNPPNNPKVSWIDKEHLLISYGKDGKTETCTGSKQLQGVDIMCQD